MASVYVILIITLFYEPRPLLARERRIRHRVFDVPAVVSFFLRSSAIRGSEFLPSVGGNYAGRSEVADRAAGQVFRCFFWGGWCLQRAVAGRETERTRIDVLV